MVQPQKEQPIRIYIYRFLSDSYAPSHAALEYNGKSIDFSSKGFADGGNDGQHGCFVYEIYPSDINVDPKKLEQAIADQQKKIKGSDYQYFTQNCADQVLAVLKKAGAKKLPNESGLKLSIPSMEGTGPAALTSRILNQQTIEDYCKKHGRLAETRKNAKEYYDIQSKFSTYMQILKDPQAFKKEMTRRCNLELQGKDPDADTNSMSRMLKEYEQTLSPEEFKQFQQKYAAILKKETNVPSAEEKAKIKAKYSALIAQANLPREKVEQQALSLLLQCHGDTLLQDRLIDIANNHVPQLVTEYKIKAEKAMQSVPFLRANQPVDAEIKQPNMSIRSKTKGRC